MYGFCPLVNFEILHLTFYPLDRDSLQLFCGWAPTIDVQLVFVGIIFKWNVIPIGKPYALQASVLFGHTIHLPPSLTHHV
eukprot:4097318-Ditylum_brightwellii.AAC.1